MKLEGSRVNYSERERALFNVLTKKGRVSTKILARLSDSFYKNQSIVSSLVILGKKIDANKEHFHLRHSKRRGPHPIEWWLEVRR
jgi:hypothetical protein